ncbi:TPA: hypothetical protein DD394_06965 [bacterium UBP9_UBA11836]|nr:hypothetical protein [bacterium UBP9_UBA11836]
MLTSIEICAGAGGQALGLKMAGFSHVALVEYEQNYCNVLKLNRPDWNVICADVKDFSGEPYRNKIDPFAGGVPCPPFSIAGKQLLRPGKWHIIKLGNRNAIKTLCSV